MNAIDFAPSALRFDFYAAPAIAHFFPTGGPARGGSFVQFTGTEFLPDLKGASEPRCRFGELATVAASVGTDAVMACRTPAADAPSTVALEVSLNAQQFTAAGQTFVTYLEPSVSALSPPQGPTGGGTRVVVSGGSFGLPARRRLPLPLRHRRGGGDLSERHGARVHDGALPAGDYCVEVSRNNQDFTSTCAPFDVVPPQTGHTISPSSGPGAGGTLVALHGANLTGGVDLRCRFLDATGSVALAATAESGVVITQAAEVPASQRSSTSVECRSPAGLGSLSYELAVTLNGQQYAAPSAWRGYHPPVVATISPTTGPLGGATVVTASGTSLAFGSDYRCAFGDAVVNATEVSGAVVNCTSPVGRSGPAPFRISLNGQQYTEPVFWAFYGAPTLAPGTISPSSGPPTATRRWSSPSPPSVAAPTTAAPLGPSTRRAPLALCIPPPWRRPARCGAPRRPPPRASPAARSPSRSTASSTRHRRRRGSTTACPRRCCRCRAAGRTRAGRSSPSPARL